MLKALCKANIYYLQDGDDDCSDSGVLLPLWQTYINEFKSDLEVHKFKDEKLIKDTCEFIDAFLETD